MMAFLTTTDPVKLSAAEALMSAAGVTATVFDRAAGTLWTSIIPMRLMIDESDRASAMTAMAAAGWVRASDGDWDVVERRPTGAGR